MGNKDILAQLKTAIGQKIAPTPPASPLPTSALQAPSVDSPSRLKAPRSGRGVQFYLDDSDRKIIHGLAVWFASQDRRVSDSQVIKAALRMAAGHQGSKLLDLCDQVRSTDRRRHPKPTP